MLLPMLPLVSHATGGSGGGGGNSYSYTYQNFYADSEGTLNVQHSDSTLISGEEQHITVNSDNTTIYVYGDYYKETYQFNPKVGEVWSGNAASWNSNALWAPKYSELPSWLTDKLLAKEGYAALYTGFMETDEVWGRKPYGVTRIGEVLGYDVYAKNGEDYRTQIPGNSVDNVTAPYQLIGEDEPITKNWALINLYRALGQTRYYIGVAPVSKSDTNVLTKLMGSDKKLDEKGRWDLNKSPVVSFLTGNIESNYTGDANPVLVVWASRTDPELYRKQAEQDALEYDIDDGRSTLSCAEFCDWVARLMEAYGEPVITETEQYMLLESYGRKLPYDLYPSQLEACKYLMVRGILDSPNELWTNWNAPITFEQAATVLMRVKDKDSRLTFKEFQLTTDLELLKKGYYPVDVAIVDGNNIVEGEPVKYESAIDSTHYDYFVRREDNRALFLSDAKKVGSTYVEVAPHVANEHSAPRSRMPDTYYRGRTQDGWYWFQVPINTTASTIYINSMNSDNDSPAQYQLEPGGGYYIVGNGTGGEEDVPTLSHYSFNSYNAPATYTDSERFIAATKQAKNKVADADISKDRVTAWLVEVSKEAFANKCTATGDDTWDAKALTWIDLAKKAPNQDKLPIWGVTSTKDPVTSVCAVGKDTPDVGDADPIPVNIYLAQNQGTRYWYFIVESQTTGITLDMARAALDVQKGMDGGLTGSSAARPTRAYCKANNEYLVSTEYLLAQGAIDAFTEMSPNRYYMSVAAPTDNAPNIDVYIDMNRNNALVVWGSVATIYDQDEILVNHMKDGTYINAALLTGKVGQSHISLPGDQGDGICLSPNTDDMAYYRVDNSIGVYAKTISFGADKVPYISLSYTNAFGNYIAVRDVRNGSDGRPTLFLLWELGEPVSTKFANNQEMLTKHEQAKQAFSNYFGRIIGGDSVLYVMMDATPEYTINADGSVPTNLTNKRSLYASTSGHVYVELPSTEAANPWDNTVPYVVQSGTQLTSLLHNYDPDGNPVVLKYNTGRKTITADNEDINEEILSSYHIQPVGIPAMVTDCTAVPNADSDNPYGSLFTGRNICRVYIGPDNLDIGVPANNLPITPKQVYIMHYGGTFLALQLYTGSFTITRDDFVPSSTAPEWTKDGKPNAITDWLKWLQQAKLKDAEDILTICIIAILQWLPRLFMFIFFVLIGLSMIANVKPWVIFCDRFFDPYKFLTAGRQTVHTVDVKKMVLCSMIALVLFGFFQNGLILGIIAWCARAVTGIISR